MNCVQILDLLRLQLYKLLKPHLRFIYRINADARCVFRTLVIPKHHSLEICFVLLVLVRLSLAALPLPHHCCVVR